MKRKASNFFILVCSLFLLNACSANLPARMSYPSVDFSGVAGADALRKLGRVTSSKQVLVSEFSDVRQEREIAFSESAKVLADGSAAELLTRGLEKALSKRGFVISPSAPVVLRGELRGWSAVVKSGFKKSVAADAAIYVEALDPGNKRVYGGVYRGHASYEGPALGEEELSETLQSSMQEALLQVLKDQQLSRLLLSY